MTPGRAAEWQAGRRAARRAIGHLTGQPAIPGSGPDRAPRWPAGLVGAITHHRGLAMALVGRAARFAGLGVDCETLIDDPDRLAPLILAPGEPALGSGAAPLTLAFSAKESLFKALSPQLGRFFGFGAAEIAAPCHGGVLLRLRQDLGGGWCRGRLIPVAVVWRGPRVLTAVILPRGGG